MCASPPRAPRRPTEESWQRAEDLASVGLVDRAAGALEQLAELHWGRAEGRVAMERAAELYVHNGESDRAALLYRQVAADGVGPLEVAARYAEAAAWRTYRNPREELTVLDQLHDLDALDAEAEARRTLLGEALAAEGVELTFEGAMNPRWHIANPLALRRQHEAGLSLEAFGNADLARLPLTWNGTYLSLEVELEVERVEWDGGFEIGLVPRGKDGPLYGLRVDGRGGGEVVWQRFACVAHKRWVDSRMPDDLGRFVAHVEVFAGNDGLSCGRRSVSPDGEAWRSVRGGGIPRPAQREWDLVIRATGQPNTLARASMYRITITGAALDPAAPAAPSARLALVDGDAMVAAERLKATARRDPALEVAIAIERDDGGALRRAVRAARSDPQAGSALLDHLVHSRLDAVRSELEPVAGAQWPLWFAHAWSTQLHTHSTDPDLVAAMLRHLEDLETIDAARPQDLPTLVLLNARRGAAALEFERIPLARRSLSRALQLAGQLPLAQRDALADVIAAVHLEQAVLAVIESQPEAAALEHVAAALERSPSPTVAADMASVRAELAPLRDAPEWGDLVERRR